MPDIHSCWKMERFFIAEPMAPREVRGWTYRGIGLFMIMSGSPKGRRKPRWSITHLGSGHRILLIQADEMTAFEIASELAEAGDWTFDGLNGWKNYFPDAPQVTRDLINRHKCIIGTGGQADESIARQITIGRGDA